jgi:hypothetical protein
MTHINDPVIDRNWLVPTGKVRGHVYDGRNRAEIYAPVVISKNQVVNFERPDGRFSAPMWPHVLFMRDLKTFLSSVVRLAEDVGDPNLPRLSVPAWDWCADRALAGHKYIWFDLWASLPAYRIAVGQYIGIDVDGSAWQRVSPFGGTHEKPGSSFDGVDFDGNASGMKPWKRDMSSSKIYQRYATKERIEKNNQLIHEAANRDNWP